MKHIPEFMIRFEDFNAELKKVQTSQDWLKFQHKWFSFENWPRNQKPSGALPGVLDGRRWSPTWWAYDLEPEARYVYFASRWVINLRLNQGLLSPNPKGRGWAQECPFCQISTRDIGVELCPTCSRRLIYAYYEPDSD